MRMILAGSPLLKEVIGWDSRGGWPGSDHGDLSSLLDAIEGDASHMPTNQLLLLFSRTFQCERLLSGCVRESYASTYLPATSSTPKV